MFQEQETQTKVTRREPERISKQANYPIRNLNSKYWVKDLLGRQAG
jgi:hypothetical protein